MTDLEIFTRRFEGLDVGCHDGLSHVRLVLRGEGLHQIHDADCVLTDALLVGFGQGLIDERMVVLITVINRVLLFDESLYIENPAWKCRLTP